MRVNEGFIHLFLKLNRLKTVGEETFAQNKLLKPKTATASPLFQRPGNTSSVVTTCSVDGGEEEEERERERGGRFVWATNQQPKATGLSICSCRST